ncbi:MAG: alpha/beta hydrolase [Cryobacterium sp.]|nr:alpha/beta hydrolase [Oligoflexia bacterium]
MKIIAAILLGFSLNGCSSLLFQPSRSLYYDPAKMNLSFQEVSFKSLDGTTLSGWYFKHTDQREKPKAVICFVHGNAQNISSHFMALTFALAKGYDFFVFDYRGYGSSAGEVEGPRAGVEDTISGLRYANERAQELGVPLAVFAQSLGTALAVRALVEEKETLHPAFITLDSSFISFEWAGASVLSQFWLTTPFQPLAFLLLSDEWAPGRRIRELAPTPILFLHGEDDRIIRPRLGREAYEAALPPKEFILVPGVGHIGAFWGADGERIRRLFLEKMDHSVETP